MRTFLLDTVNWDLVLDATNNIAVADDPYSLAQDAASAVKTFQGEVYYNTTLGVPYWDTILGKWPSLAYVKAKFVEAALTVPGVVAAQAFISSFKHREIQGQVQVSDIAGKIIPVNF